MRQAIDLTDPVVTAESDAYITALDVGWPNDGWDSVKLVVESWLPLIDHVLFNEVETTAMGGCESLDSAMQWFHERIPSAAVLTIALITARSVRYAAEPAHLSRMASD